MAIFGKKIGGKQERKMETRIHRARARMSTDGAAHDIIRAPWFSEKALVMTEKSVYVFDVRARADKSDIAGAIKEIYNITPSKIRIVNLPAKRKNLRTKRGVGKRSARRKAYVYLNAGDSIQLA